MAPRKNISAPANRIYKSRTPLQQAKFPDKNKRVTSYGKKSTRRPPKQETLTQMDFVKLQQLMDEGEEENFGIYEEEIEKPKRKRRKTAGELDGSPDEENGGVDKNEAKESKKERRKTAGDRPSATPQYYTQTITQLDWSFTSAPEEDPPQEAEEDATGFDDNTFNVSSSSQFFQIPGNLSRLCKPDGAVRQNSSKPNNPAKGVIGTPRTPQRTLAKEIPSSESPATPTSLHSRASGSQHSILKEKSTNIPIPFNPNQKPPTSPYKLPKLEIEDTFDTATAISQLTHITTTPTKRPSSAKIVRFAAPDDVLEEPATTPSIKQESTQPPTPHPSLPKNLKFEILDSDAESDEDYEDYEDEKQLDESDQDEEALQPETCYGEIGEATQVEVERLLSSPPLTGIIDESQVEEETVNEGMFLGSPTLTQVIEEPEMEEIAKDIIIEEKTQIMESQRLATQQIASMAPRTTNSDVFVSIPPQQVTDILHRKKNHDMRNWAYPSTVRRIWIYETKPVSTLKYMAVISPAKRPGQIVGESGLGNAEFNAKKGRSWHAYEILELYELADPLPLARLLANEWLQHPPKKFDWVRPAVLDSLMANLMPPIITQRSNDEPSSSSTDTQEADAQLLSTIKQFTQAAPSSLPASSQAVQAGGISREVIPSSQRDSPSIVFKHNPSQATTVDLSQSQTPRNLPISDIVWESPTRPVPTSTPLKLPTPRSGGSDYHVQDSIVPYSMASSQVLTKSQMLPESLLDDSVPAPPLFIQDSDEEEDED